MPPRDEEARFEQVLARHLRYGGANAGCPNAETLAAYHERALTAEEMDAFQGHIAACGRCREVLAGLEASEEVAAREKSTRAAVLTPAAGPAQARPMRVWKWMAPAAAVAAGILVWVAVRQTPRAPVETTVALNKQSAEAVRAAPKPGAQAPAESADERARVARKQSQAISPAATPPASRGGTGREADRLNAQLNGTNQKLAQKPPRRDENAQLQEYFDAGRAQDQFPALKKQPAQENSKAPAAPPAQGAMEPGKKDAGQQLAAAEKQAPMDKEAAAVTAGSAAETKAIVTLNEPKKERLERLAKPAAGPRAAAALRGTGAFFAKDTAGLVLTPGKRVMWRVGAAGMILKTADGGLSWIQQASGVSAELLAGSAPSETVCWVVGRGGTILRTTDGGHWENVASPTKADLLGIDAQDAQTAVIGTSEKLPKYVTRDGGKTWQPLAQ